MKQLVRRNALQVADTSFDDNCRRLVAAIEEVLEKAAAERREREEKERLEHEPQSPPLSEVAPSTNRAKPEADKLSIETSKVVYPLPPKPAEPGREKPPQPPRPSKQVIVFLTIAAVLVVSGLIYFAIRPSQSPPPQPAPIAAVTPSHGALTTPAQVATIPSYVTPMPYVIENGRGGSAAPWHPGGTWLLGNRDNQPVVAINVTSPDNGATLTGTMVYRGEGPIGFKGRQAQ